LEAPKIEDTQEKQSDGSKLEAISDISTELNAAEKSPKKSWLILEDHRSHQFSRILHIQRTFPRQFPQTFSFK
jgi:hypothetical protein